MSWAHVAQHMLHELDILALKRALHLIAIMTFLSILCKLTSKILHDTLPAVTWLLHPFVAVGEP